MHDCNDWPVSFLGSIYAGIIPVAVNTLLTADDYLYMLQHSRAQAVLVSNAILPVLMEAMSSKDHEVKNILVSGAGNQLMESCDNCVISDFGHSLDSATPMTEAADTAADEAAFWLYSSGSTGKPKGTVHTHSSPYWTSENYAKGVLNIQESDICFSAAKLFFAYGLGNALTFPLSVGATSVLLAGRPTPDVIYDKLAKHKPTHIFWSTDRLCCDASAQRVAG